MDKELLKKIPLFASLSDDDLGGLKNWLEARTVPPNQAIFWIGEKGDELFIVQYGQVRLSYTNEAGQDVTLAVVGAGAFFGDLSLLDGGPRTATALAQNETGMWVLNRQNFFKFLAQHPRASEVMVSTMASRLRENTEKLRSIKNVNEEADEKITTLQRVVDQLANHFSSGSFLISVILFALLWMVVQTSLVLRHHPETIKLMDDPPTFAWLGFLVSLASFLLTVFVLNSQKRQAERDRIRADFEYQVNLKAQLEIMQLHQKMDKLTEMVGAGSGKTGA
ncbi:MAG: cyclic nucleotide-binding domain-containing protein [Tepidisphaerales bacterium]